MPIDDRTANRSYKLPNVSNFLAEDVARLRDALNAIDADVDALIEDIFNRYTKQEVDQLIAALIEGAPGDLDTLNGLAAAINDDPNFANTVASRFEQKANVLDVWTKTQADARYLQGVTQTENLFTGNGTQTAFTLTQAPPNKESLLVTVEGIVQPTAEYSISGATLTLSEAPATGSRIRVLMLGYTGAVQSVTGANEQPSWTGKLNGWPDPFFRALTTASGDSFYGRDRWYNPLASWTLVNNTIFDGKALRRDVTATTGPLNGPAIWFDEIGATLGSQVTVRALVTGNGATMRLYGRTYSSATTPGAGFVSAQLLFSDESGATLITTSATPQLLTLTVTVAATETGIALYTTHTQNTLHYDIVALWAYKGSSETGPKWPTLNDELRANIATNTANIATNTANIATNTANIATNTANILTNATNINYAVLSTTSIGSSSSSTTLNGTAFSTFARDLPFTGWGEVYTPAGISFNAIQIASLTRTASAATSKWRTIYVVIKAAASNAQAGTVVAVGSVNVNPESATLSNLTILLKNPSTGAVITLSDANLSSQYFIGIYARNASGGLASCGEHRGTLSNTAGQSFYVTSADPLGTSAWLAYTANARLGVRHLLLTSPTEGLVYDPTTEFLADIQSQLPLDQTPELILPPTIYAVQGREANVYFDNLLLEDVSRYNVDVTSASSTGAHQNERWTWTPSGALTSGSLTIALHSKSTAAQLVSKSAAQRAAASTAGSGTNKKVMLIGDSLTNAGTITQTLLDIAGADVMGVTLYGTRGSGSNKHEGRGGWSVISYTSATHVDSTPNPFWDGSAVNFSWYLTQNSYPALDWVFIQLGTNDVFSLTSDSAAVSGAQASLTALDVLINSIKASDANTKVGLLIAPPPSFDQDSFGANYATGQTRWRFKRNILIWAREMISKYQGQEASRVFVVPSNTGLDTLNNMARDASAPVNSRSSVTASRQANGVHPATSGYQQIGDALWAFLKCQS